jgi:hypothetical protein
MVLLILSIDDFLCGKYFLSSTKGLGSWSTEENFGSVVDLRSGDPLIFSVMTESIARLKLFQKDWLSGMLAGSSCFKRVCYGSRCYRLIGI